MICNDIYIGCIEIIWVTLELFGTSHFPCDCYLAPNPDGLLLIRKLNHKPPDYNYDFRKTWLFEKSFLIGIFLLLQISLDIYVLTFGVDWFWFLQVSVSWQSAWRFGKERKASVYFFNKLRFWQPTKIIGRKVLFTETNNLFALIFIHI